LPAPASANLQPRLALRGKKLGMLPRGAKKIGPSGLRASASLAPAHALRARSAHWLTRIRNGYTHTLGSAAAAAASCCRPSLRVAARHAVVSRRPSQRVFAAAKPPQIRRPRPPGNPRRIHGVDRASTSQQLLRNYILMSDKSRIVAIGLINFFFICNVATGTMYLIYIV
jgi:hypothetical protein